MQRDIGIVVFPEFFQNEGIESVLDNIQKRADPCAIATSPYVMRPSDAVSGSREPPIDGGLGTVRLLDRPLWGKRELFVQTSVSYEPAKRFYEGLRYQPPAPDIHTKSDGGLIAAVLGAARKRGLKVNLQVQAAIPPGYRVQFGGPTDDDEPRLFDDSRVTDRLDKNGSLASPHIRAYTIALLRDLAAAYPDIDGFHIDWPEYPPYTLDSAFLDFSGHASAAASRLGFDFEVMRKDTREFHAWFVGRMTMPELVRLAAERTGLAPVFGRYPGFADLLRFKAQLAVDFVRSVRTAVPGKQLLLRSFPSPWTGLSGFDFPQMARHCDAIATKLFTMHWPMMVGSWAKRLVRENPALGSTTDVAVEVARLFDLCDTPERFGAAIGEYPGSEAVHPVDRAAQIRKISFAAAQAGSTPLYAMAHGFGPPADFSDRLRAAFDAAAGRVWINRYGYLSDTKLDLIGRIGNDG